MRNAARFLFTVIIIIIPLVIIISAIRVALTPIFISVEYRLPGFPPDPYGFSTADRLMWAKYSIDYLLGRISHNELTNTTLADGIALFNPRELVHMLDVQILTQQVLNIWYILLALLGVAVLIAILQDKKREIVDSIKRGATLTLFLIFAVLIYLAANFNQLFTKFHQIFFEGDSWLFLMTDNLIRLFPIRFWRDIFIFIGGLSALISIIILLIPLRISSDRRL